MELDKLQQAWQTESSEMQVTVHADELMKAAQRQQHGFRQTIFWRDVREVGVAIIMLPIWVILGIAFALPWTWYLTILSLLWLIGFMIIDRMIKRSRTTSMSDSLVSTLEQSLAEVDHQIWLLRNVFWWYLLPFCISILAFFLHSVWNTSSHWLEFAIGFGMFSLILGLVYGFVYWINQKAVSGDLLPKHREIADQLLSLQDENVDPKGRGVYSASYDLPSDRLRSNKVGLKRRYAVASAILALAAGLLIVVIPLGLLSPLADRISQIAFPNDFNPDAVAQTTGASGNLLAELVTQVRNDKKLVGMAAMVMVDGQVQSATAVGFRKLGSDIPIDLNDRWHLGGLSKPVTATMIGRLVEAGQMNWDDTIDEYFSDATIHPSWKSVTLVQLLTDTAGAPVDFPNEYLIRGIQPGPECTQARRKAVLETIAKETSYPSGQRHVYSNVGYSIIGAMAEAKTGVAFEQLIEREVFKPLKLASAGFGPPVSLGNSLSQPVGHRTLLNGKIADDYQTDNSMIMSPSATMHMTIADLCAFTNEHRLGAHGQGTLLTPETYNRLHTPIHGYACGWVQSAIVQPNTPISYWHNGCNTLWYAYVHFIPQSNTVIAVTSNDGDGESGVLEVANWIESPIAYFENVGFPKRSPYATVRWNEAQPEVQLDDQWYSLVSINDVPVTEIIEFSQRTEKEIWKKRFEEDLVELMIRMGKPPGNRVALTVHALGSQTKTTFKNVAMSEEYRKDIRNSAEATKQGTQ